MRSHVLSKIAILFTVILTQIGLAEWLNEVFQLPAWFGYVWKALIIVLGMEVFGFLTPNTVYPYGLFSLAISLKGRDRIKYLIVFGLSVFVYVIIIRETYNLTASLRVMSFLLGLLILLFIPISLFGTPDMKRFSRQ